MFDTKKPYNLGVQPRFQLYDVFTLRKPFLHFESRTNPALAKHLAMLIVQNFYKQLEWQMMYHNLLDGALTTRMKRV